MDPYTEVNRRHWDEVVPIHLSSESYAPSLKSLRAGQSGLHMIERQELLPIRGRSLLHLQCHFGLDSLSLALEGADVTGMDFSSPAINTARKLATELGIPATFVVSDLYDLPANLKGQFDIVFTSYGVLCWLPDLVQWAKVIAHFLKPGGFFYMVEFHPIQQSLELIEDDPTISDLKLRYPYFATAEPLKFDSQGTYADRSARLENRSTYFFPHSLGEIVTALVDVGLHIEFLHEFPFTIHKILPFVDAAADGSFRLTKGEGTIPLLFSVKASAALSEIP